MGQTKSAIDQLVCDLVSTLDPAEVLVELEQAASLIESERTRLLGLFSSRKVYRDLEYSSASAFLVDRCKITPSRAGRLVAQAAALAGMPRTAEGWSNGVLAADQVRHLVVCQQTDPDTFSAHEGMLCDTVASLSVIDTGKALTYWRELASPERTAADQEKLYGRRRFHLSQTFEGMFRIDGYLDPLAGELVRTALDAATPPPTEGDPRTPAQRRADALTELARRRLDTGDLPDQGGEKPHLVVLVGVDRLHRGIGLAETVGGTVLTQTAVDLLACDCAVSRVVFGPNSEIIDLGRKTRVISPALRRAVIARDRHCQHRGCYRPAKWCDIDHIVAWQDGGHTRLDNLQLLCRYHHRLKHRRVRPRPPHPPRKELPRAAPRSSTDFGNRLEVDYLLAFEHVMNVDGDG